jgi:hypothetical protein
MKWEGSFRVRERVARDARALAMWGKQSRAAPKTLVLY